MKKFNQTEEPKIPVLPDMELLATQTSSAVAKKMNLDDEKTAEMNMALSDARINAFERSGSSSEIKTPYKIFHCVLLRSRRIGRHGIAG